MCSACFLFFEPLCSFQSPSLFTSTSLFFCHRPPFLPLFFICLSSLLQPHLSFTSFCSLIVSLQHKKIKRICQMSISSSVLFLLWHHCVLIFETLEEFPFSSVCPFSMTPLHFCGTEILLYTPSSFAFFLAVLIQV